MTLKTNEDPIVIWKYDNTFLVKLSGDSCNIGIARKPMNFTFTVTNEGAKAKTASGNYTLGIFDVESENYSELKNCLTNLLEDINNIQSIKITNEETEAKKTYKLKYSFVSDMKFAGLMLGLKYSNCNNSCKHCKCDITVCNTHDDWSMTDVSKGTRTIEEAISESKNPKPKNGYSKTPILNLYWNTRYFNRHFTHVS